MSLYRLTLEGCGGRSGRMGMTRFLPVVKLDFEKALMELVPSVMLAPDRSGRSSPTATAASTTLGAATSMTTTRIHLVRHAGRDAMEQQEVRAAPWDTGM